jgi:hypothetical protein
MISIQDQPGAWMRRHRHSLRSTCVSKRSLNHPTQRVLLGFLADRQGAWIVWSTHGIAESALVE